MPANTAPNWVIDDLRDLCRKRNQCLNRQRLINQPAEQDLKRDLHLADPKLQHKPLEQKQSKALYRRAMAMRKKALRAVKTVMKQSGMEGSIHNDLAEQAIRDSFSGLELEILLERILDLCADLPSLAVWERKQKGLEQLIADRARLLPACQWWCSHHGLNVGGLGKIIGETGELAGYPLPGKVWKRMGLAPYEKDGVVRSLSTWRLKGGLTAEDWVAAGYNPRRRSTVYQIGSAIIKSTKEPGKSRWRDIYDEKKLALLTQYAAIRAKEEGEGLEKKQQTWPDMRVHRYAQRYMEKRLLRELWLEWTGLDDGGWEANFSVSASTAEEHA